MKVGAVTEEQARELAAQFCIATAAGPTDHVNRCIDVLTDLLVQIGNAGYEAGECWGSKDDVAIRWELGSR